MDKHFVLFLYGVISLRFTIYTIDAKLNKTVYSSHLSLCLSVSQGTDRIAL